MSIIIRNPAMVSKRSEFINEASMEIKLVPRFDFDRIEWLVSGHDFDEMKIKLEEDELIIDVTITTSDFYRDEELGRADAVVQKRTGATRADSGYDDEVIWAVYTIDIRKLSCEEMLNRVQLLLKESV